ncbi:MAG: DUF2914 domain-containing protein [Gammaproteobacteria bacterium]|nr:DUF2914 domain-containing protein [Gammaproteobacteria bacterium]
MSTPAIAQSGASEIPEPSSPRMDTGRIARAQFTTLVEDREPIDNLATTSTALPKLFFFTEFIGMTGQELTHRWRYFDEVVAEIDFSIKGPRWRVNSYKSLTSELSGDWAVEIVNSEGTILNRYDIRVKQSDTNTEPVITISDSEDAQTSGEGKIGNVGTSIQSAGARSSAIETFPRGKPSSNLAAIRQIFPDGDYVLVNDSLGSPDCPESGQFNWQHHEHDLWTLNMGSESPIRLYDNTVDPVALTPDPFFSNTPESCLTYTNHHFDSSRQELVTQLHNDCVGGSEDLFFVHALTRTGERVDLTMHSSEYVVCRYQLQ